MWILTLLLLPLPANIEVAVQPLSGAKQSGTLVQLDNKQIGVEVDGTKVTYDVRDLMTLVVRELDATSTADVYVELVDGTQISGARYLVKDRTAEIDIGARTINIETRNIHSVRFHAPSDDLDDQWQEISEEDSQGDVIVLRRSSSSLDQLEGVFHSVTDDTVEFEYDDEKIPVKRTKLEGMFYHHAVGRELPDAICVVQETGGTTWHARSIELKDQQLQLQTTSGVKADVPWSTIARLDFSSGNVVYLSDMQFDLAECRPFIASFISAERIRQLYAPRLDSSFEGGGLWLASDEEVLRFDKGLSIHSRSQLVFRLTEPYRKLTTTIGIDSRLQGRGNLVLVIEGDNKELLRKEISGDDPPLPVDLNIEGVRRLKILVDFGQSLDVADHLNLCEARIIK